MALGQGDVLLEMPCEPLHPLADDFRRFVDTAFDHPWVSTQSIRDYLAIGVTTIYLRATRSGDEPPDWYVQVTFSGCAGMADTSAEVATHWAELWYRRVHEDLASKYFHPFGFTPAEIEATGPAKRFVPLGRLGYALFYTDDEAADLEAASKFEVDGSVHEALSDLDLTEDWRELDQALSDVRAAGACLCQLCAPRLDLSRFERLSLVQRVD